MNENRVSSLTDEATELVEQRARIVGRLKDIAAEMWRAGLQNVRDLGRRTGLSRTTLYAALRERGIEPTERNKEQERQQTHDRPLQAER
ncbi:hypothetical protein JBE04_01840 [Streptomyces sp. PRKS01-29]|nr:hypothetical protein [Streptomyces sabulosicollis]MBI0293269.1 hypothetical protein [Streptomyces sabulosicollis]